MSNAMLIDFTWLGNYIAKVQSKVDYQALQGFKVTIVRNSLSGWNLQRKFKTINKLRN